ncbi:MAG TPA: hypothetical protein VIX19_21060 [Terriglobales bacterium]
MLAACLLLAIAVLSGMLLTLLYDSTATLPARLAMGTATGLPILAAVGFLFTLWLGPGPFALGLSAMVMLLPCLLLVHRPYRTQVSNQHTQAARALSQAFARPTPMALTVLAFYIAIAVLLGLVFARAMYETPQGIFTGVRNNLGDGPLHLQIIFSFAQGHNFPPDDPTYAGIRFAYPFLVDFLSSMLVRAGANIFAAMWIQSMMVSLALVGMLHYWTLLLTRNRLAGLIAPALVLLSGGLGWTWLFQDLHSSQGLFPLLGHLPHDYTIMDAGEVLRWGNSLTTLFVPQRSILFGMPLAICVFSIWWRAIDQQSSGPPNASRRSMMASGFFAGLLPLTHAHTFLVVIGVGACLALIFARLWKDWALLFGIATIVALPQVRWLGGSGGVKLESFLGWQPGWDHGAFNAVPFWLVNTGLFIPLLLLAILWTRPDVALPRQLIKYYLPFTFCFIVPNLVKVAPWIWDNIKVLVWWFVASAPLVAGLLARGLQAKSKWRWLSAGALVCLTLAGALDVLRVITGATEYLEFDTQGIAIAEMISKEAAPRALVLHDPTFNSPVFLTGRRSLLGYPGWMWSRGIDSSERQAEIERMYAGAPDAESLLRNYRVDYVLVGPAEQRSLKVNTEFWSRYPTVAEAGPYRLYKTSIEERGKPR